MTTFNLKTAKAKEGDIHYEKKLQENHSESPNSITQDQLESYRSKEPNSLTENLLDEKRTGGSEVIIEKRMNDSKSGLHKHRNAESYSGDINKLEEKRVSSEKQEDEKSELASETPDSKKWWENLKKASGVKGLSSFRKKASEEVKPLSFDDPWSRINDTWTEEEGVETETYFDPEKNIPEESEGKEDLVFEEYGGEPIFLKKVQPVDSPIGKGAVIEFGIDPDAMDLDLEILKKRAFDVLASNFRIGKRFLEIGPDSFTLEGNSLIARLVGDQFHDLFSKPGLNVNKQLNEIEGDSEFDVSESPFSISDLQETEVPGILLGVISVDANDSDLMDSFQGMSDERIKKDIIDAIGESNPDINVEEDGIDLDKIESGIINFVGQKSESPKKKKESWENVKGDPIASNDFDIVVLSETKKN